MKKFLMLIFFPLLLTACGGANYPYGTPTPTPNPGEIALSMLQQQVAAIATEQVVGLQFSATAQILGVTSTAEQLRVYNTQTEQARMDAQATDAQARKDAQATQARVDSDAATRQAIENSRIATEQAVIAIRQTQNADATATFTVMTLTAIPPHATLTQMAVDNQIIVNSQNVEQSALDLQRARDTNKISWMVPLLAALTALGAGLLWVVRKSRWNAFSDEDGKLLGFGFDEKYVNPRLLTGPVLNLKTNEVSGSSPDQIEVTKRAQIVEALSVMPEQPTTAAANVFNKYFGQQDVKRPVIEVVKPEQIGDSILNEIEGQIVED